MLKAARGGCSSCWRLLEEAAQAAQGCSRRLRKLLKAGQGGRSSCSRLPREAAQAAQGCSRKLLKLRKAARGGCSSCSRLLEKAAQAAQGCSRRLPKLLKAARGGCSSCSRLLGEAAQAAEGCPNGNESRGPCSLPPSPRAGNAQPVCRRLPPLPPLGTSVRNAMPVNSILPSGQPPGQWRSSRKHPSDLPKVVVRERKEA